MNGILYKCECGKETSDVYWNAPRTFRRLIQPICKECYERGGSMRENGNNRAMNDSCVFRAPNYRVRIREDYHGQSFAGPHD
jgi:hypothetical protein